LQSFAKNKAAYLLTTLYGQSGVVFFQELFPATLPELNTKHPAKGQLPIPLRNPAIITRPSGVAMANPRFCQRWAERGDWG